jgi:hypothetical protein
MRGEYVKLVEQTLGFAEEEKNVDLSLPSLQAIIKGWMLVKAREDETYLHNPPESVLEDFEEDLSWMYGEDLETEIKLIDFETIIRDAKEKVDLVVKGETEEPTEEPEGEESEEEGEEEVLGEPAGDGEDIENMDDDEEETKEGEEPIIEPQPEKLEDEEETIQAAKITW